MPELHSCVTFIQCSCRARIWDGILDVYKHHLGYLQKLISAIKRNHKLCTRVDLVSHSVIGKKDLPNSWPLCLIKLPFYLFLIFTIFGKAHTFLPEHKKNVRGQLFILWTIFQISAFKFSNQIAGPPCPSHLNFHIYPNTCEVILP